MQHYPTTWKTGNITFGPGFRDPFSNLEQIWAEMFGADNLPTASYPPYNVVEVDEGHILIEVAAAGFKKENLNVELDGSQLIITGHATKEAKNRKYHAKKLAQRDFKQVFELKGQLEVEGVSFTDGILAINLRSTVKKQQYAIE